MNNHNHEKINVISFTISNWFESNNNKSEITFVSARFGFFSPFAGYFNYTSVNPDYPSQRQDAKVKLSKDKMNQIQPTDITIFAPSNYEPNTSKCFDIPWSYGWEQYFATAVYERDWISSRKLIFSTYQYITSAPFYREVTGTVPRRFLYDYYYWPHSTNKSYNFIQRHPVNGSIYNASLNGNIQLQRNNY